MFFIFNLKAKDPVTKGETDPVMLDLDPYMIEALRSKKFNGRFGKEGSIIQLMQEPAFQELVEKHDLQLFNGPMLGSITSTSAKVWIRSAGPAKFQVKIVDKLSEEVVTTEESDYTGVATVRGLSPFTDYSYSIILNGLEIKKDYFKIRNSTSRRPGC